MGNRKGARENEDDNIVHIKSVSSAPICSQGETDTDVIMQHQRGRLSYWQHIRFEKSQNGPVKTQEIYVSHPPTVIQTSVDFKPTDSMSPPPNLNAIQTSVSFETKSYRSPPPPPYLVQIQTLVSVPPAGKMSPLLLPSNSIHTLDNFKTKEQNHMSPPPPTAIKTSVNLRTPVGKGLSDQEGVTNPIVSLEKDTEDNEYGGIKVFWNALPITKMRVFLEIQHKLYKLYKLYNLQHL